MSSANRRAVRAKRRSRARPPAETSPAVRQAAHVRLREPSSAPESRRDGAPAYRGEREGRRATQPPERLSAEPRDDRERIAAVRPHERVDARADESVGRFRKVFIRVLHPQPARTQCSDYAFRFRPCDPQHFGEVTQCDRAASIASKQHCVQLFVRVDVVAKQRADHVLQLVGDLTGHRTPRCSGASPPSSFSMT
jgi:hypothetical protein